MDLERIVLAYHLDDPHEKFRDYAKILCGDSGRVALVNLDDCEAQLLSLSGDSETPSGADQPVVFAETENIAERLIPAISNTVEILNDSESSQVNLLMNIEASFRYRAVELLDYYRELTIITTCKPQDVVETYKVLKDWSDYLSEGHKVSLFVCDAVDSESGDEVYYKLANACKEFLGRVLIPAGCSVVNSEPAAGVAEVDLEDLLAADKPLGDEEDVHIDDDEDVLAEAHELGDEFVEEIEADSNDSDVHVGKLEFCDSVMNSPQTLYPIVVGSLPQDDVQLSNYLQLALPRWLTTVPTAMAIPLSLPRDMDRSIRVLIDATGRVYVLSVGLCASEGIINRALAAYKWLCVNLSSIAGSCRQLKIDLSVAPGIIMVAGGVAETLEIAMDDLNERKLPEAISCQIMKLYFLQNETETALLTMPV